MRQTGIIAVRRKSRSTRGAKEDLAKKEKEKRRPDCSGEGEPLANGRSRIERVSEQQGAKAKRSAPHSNEIVGMTDSKKRTMTEGKRRGFSSPMFLNQKMLLLRFEV